MHTSITKLERGFICQQKWSEMDPAQDGRYCSACSKIVIDFTTMNDEQIIKYLEYQKKTNLCARLSNEQMERVNYILQKTPQSNKYLVTLLFSFLLYSNIFAQDKPYRINNTITSSHVDSIVISGKLESLNDVVPFASITVSNSSMNTFSGLDGKFEIHLSKDQVVNQNLEISYVGYGNISIPIIEIENKDIGITMNEKLLILDGIVVVGGICSVPTPPLKRLWWKIRSWF